MLRLKEAPKYVQFSTRSQERHCRLKLPTVLALGEEAGGWAGPEGAGSAPAASRGPALTPVPPPSPPGSNASERPLLAPGPAGRCAPLRELSARAPCTASSVTYAFIQAGARPQGEESEVLCHDLASTPPTTALPTTWRLRPQDLTFASL